MSNKITMYIEPVPLGKGYLLKEKQTFLSRGREIPGDLAAALVKKTREFEYLQGWLAQEYAAAARRGTEITIPDEVRNILCPEAPSAETPKSTDTAAPSKKKSPTRRKKTASKSSTSQKTE